MSDASIYPKDAAELLVRWDAGQSIWTIEMGGLGPGYEQAIQVLMIAMLRSLLHRQVDCTLVGESVPEDRRRANWKQIYDDTERDIKPTLEQVGPSGAQFDAAWGLAWNFYRDDNPEHTVLSMPDESRRIQASRHWPQEVTG